MMFKTEEQCHEYLTTIDKLYYKGNGSGCNGAFDNVICWEATPANKTVQIRCPNIKGLFDITKNLSKRCLENGQWEGYNQTNKPYGFTNFKVCYTENSMEQTREIENLPNYQLILSIVSHIELVGLILSFLCICFSLFIFGYHKNLRCKRTKIHLNLFITIFIQSTVRILFFVDRYLFRTLNPDLIAYESQFMLLNNAICPLMQAVLEYIQMCNFMWMLNEGAYLNILLTYSVFDDNKRGIMIASYIVGWGLPAVAVITWGSILLNTNGIDDICWSGYYNWKSYWIIKAPILIALTINVVCLLNVIRILANKLRENRTSEIEQVKKSLKAAILLLPLFGITHIFEVYEFEPNNWIVYLIFAIIKAILVFYQGVFLSILYCFMNNEVKNAIKRNWLNKIKFKSKCFDLNKTRNKNTNKSKTGIAEGDNLLEIQLAENSSNTKTAFTTMSRTDDTCI